jgi:DNA-binding response OmpR family regulator
MSSSPDRQDADFRLVPERLVVLIGDREVVVTATQLRLLAVLTGEPGRVVSRAELIQRAFTNPVDERTVDVHIKELRRRLDEEGSRIETVRGQGYGYLETQRPG